MSEENSVPEPPQVPPSAPASARSASALDAIIPTNPFAALSCYAGIFSVVLCFLGIILGPLAIVFGILGLKAWKVQESTYGNVTSKIRIWIGIVTGSIGTILSIVMIIMMVAGGFE